MIVAYAHDILRWRYLAPDDCYDVTDALSVSVSPSENPRPWLENVAGRRSFLDASAQAGAVVSAIAEMSNSSLIFSLTSTPPVSSAALKFRPQSERLMVAPPSKPTLVLP
jgi:hypothetical protein